MASTGEKQAWDILSEIDPELVQSGAGVLFDRSSSSYLLKSLGQDIHVALRDKDIFSDSMSGKLLLDQLGEYSRLSILRYLIHARDIPETGNLIRPSDLPGGGIFSKGTHVLPLDEIAVHFGNNREEFFKKGMSLGSTRSDYGDMSIKLLPFFRIPAVLIVWSGDKEFPAKSSFLFDSSCASQLSTDIIWSTAMMCIEMMLLSLNE